MAARPRGLKRRSPRLDRPRAEEAIRAFLDAMGIDLADPHLAETPARVVSAWSEVLIEGYRRDPIAELGETFDAPSQGAVVVRGIPILSMCPHHLLPLTGEAHLGFLPRGKIPGFGRLARFVDALAHRLVLQEALTQGIADALHQALDARATAVVIEAQHLCVAVTDPGRRGVVFRSSVTLGDDRDTDRLIRQIDAGRTAIDGGAKPKRAR